MTDRRPAVGGGRGRTGPTERRVWWPIPSPLCRESITCPDVDRCTGFRDNQAKNRPTGTVRHQSVVILEMLMASSIAASLFTSILVAVLLGTVWGMVFLWWMLGRIKSASAERIDREIANPGEILLQETGANFFGLQSRGGMQVRGNGGLVLTNDQLRFFQLLPEREIAIPLDRIEETSLVRSHCGKSVLWTLLRVTYRIGPEATRSVDSAAWYVRNPAEWKRVIDEHRAPTPAGGI